MKYSNVIRHYASEYYDPVKAHEYYEEHKKLKGRRSTTGLNEQGKNAASYVKEKLNEEHKQKVEQSKTTMQNTIDSSKSSMESTIETSKTHMQNSIDQHTTQMQSKIENLNRKIKSMKGSNSSYRKVAIRNEIVKLRNENKAKRAELQAAYKETAAGARSEHKSTTATARSTHSENVKNLKTEYDEKYLKELDAIKSDSSMLATKKSSSKKSSKKTTKANTAPARSLSEIRAIIKKKK